MTILSDNEIVAVVARNGESWPGPLPTVILEESGLLRAALLGVRSLVERGLATMDGIDYSVDDDVRQLVRSVVAADVASSVHVAEDDRPGQLRGSSAYLYSSPSGTVIDLLTTGGVHNLAEVDPDAGVAVLAGIADNVFRTGIDAPSDSSPALFARSSASAARSIRVTHGQMSSGLVDGDGAESTFEETESGLWDEAEFEDFVSVGKVTQ